MARVACAALPLSPQRGEGRGEGCEWPIAFNSAGRPHSFEPNPSGIGQECPRAATVHWQALAATIHTIPDSALATVELQACARRQFCSLKCGMSGFAQDLRSTKRNDARFPDTMWFMV